jgi:hypothetical protein
VGVGAIASYGAEIRAVAFQRGHDDCMVWLVDASNCYSIKSAYKVLTETNNPGNQLPFSKIWHKLVPLKVAVFGWQTVQNRIPSKENLSKRGIIDNVAVNCVRGCGKVESSQHIPFECT